MERFLTFAIGVVFTVGGFILAKDAIFSVRRNIAESVIFGVLGMMVGIFLLVLAITWQFE